MASSITNSKMPKRLFYLVILFFAFSVQGQAFAANEAIAINSIKQGLNSSAKRVIRQENLFQYSDNKGQTLLIIASISGNEVIAKYLIENGASLNSVTISKSTALHLAVRYGRNDLVRLLLKSGAQYDLQDFTGYTPLMRAVDIKNTEAMEILLGYPVDLNIRNNREEDVFDLALTNNNYTYFAYLVGSLGRGDAGHLSSLYSKTVEEKEDVASMIVHNRQLEIVDLIASNLRPYHTDSTEYFNPKYIETNDKFPCVDLKKYDVEGSECLNFTMLTTLSIVPRLVGKLSENQITTIYPHAKSLDYLYQDRIAELEVPKGTSGNFSVMSDLLILNEAKKEQVEIMEIPNVKNAALGVEEVKEVSNVVANTVVEIGLPDQNKTLDYLYQEKIVELEVKTDLEENASLMAGLTNSSTVDNSKKILTEHSFIVVPKLANAAPLITKNMYNSIEVIEIVPSPLGKEVKVIDTTVDQSFDQVSANIVEDAVIEDKSEVQGEFIEEVSQIALGTKELDKPIIFEKKEVGIEQVEFDKEESMYLGNDVMSVIAGGYYYGEREQVLLRDVEDSYQDGNNKILENVEVDEEVVITLPLISSPTMAPNVGSLSVRSDFHVMKNKLGIIKSNRPVIALQESNVPVIANTNVLAGTSAMSGLLIGYNDQSKSNAVVTEKPSYRSMLLKEKEEYLFSYNIGSYEIINSPLQTESIDKKTVRPVWVDKYQYPLSMMNLSSIRLAKNSQKVKSPKSNGVDKAESKKSKKTKSIKVESNVDSAAELKKRKGVRKPGYFIQLGAFKNFNSAKKIAIKGKAYGNVYYTQNEKSSFVKVLVGPYSSKKVAKKLTDSTVFKKDFKEYLIIRK